MLNTRAALLCATHPLRHAETRLNVGQEGHPLRAQLPRLLELLVHESSDHCPANFLVDLHSKKHTKTKHKTKKKYGVKNVTKTNTQLIHTISKHEEKNISSRNKIRIHHSVTFHDGKKTHTTKRFILKKYRKKKKKL